MVLSVGESVIIIAVCAICTFLERALPFLIFGSRPAPRVVTYLGSILPMAVIATLVIYCIRNINFSASVDWMPQIIAVAVTAILHIIKGNMLLTVAGGTVVYMLLVQVIFV